MIERIRDLLCSLLFLVVFWPFYVIIAIVIVCVSPGNPVYMAQRVGKNGKVFTLLKFRTMRVDSGAVRITTLSNDDRVFPFGRFLRRSKLDETLQIFNILQSEMTIVGFRPEDQVNASKLFCDEYAEILKIKPGLTSPASLFDYTHGEEFDNEEDYVKNFLPLKLELELFYAENKSFLYDIKIILRTVKIIFLKTIGVKKFPYPPEYQAILLRLQKKKQRNTEAITY